MIGNKYDTAEYQFFSDSGSAVAGSKIILRDTRL